MRRDRVTIVDVAVRAGVSPSTASRVVTGKPVVRPDLAEGVWRAVEELGYRPNVAARGLRQARSMSLGLVFHNLTVPTQLELIRGVEAVCQPAGYSLLVTDSRSDDKLYVDLMHRLYERRVDGVFLVAPGQLGKALEDYPRAAVPVLALQTSQERSPDLPVIATSERRALQEAVRCLIEAGHRQIGCVSGAWEGARQRLRLIEEAAQRATTSKVTIARAQVSGGATSDSVRSAVRQLLSRDPPPTAIFVNLQHLIPALAELRARDLRIPLDLSVVSIGDAPWLPFADPPLAAVQVDWEALGSFAAHAMLDWIGGRKPRRTLFAARGTFEARSSVGPVPVEKASRRGASSRGQQPDGAGP